MDPKISIIVPIYNVEQYLRECLDSIINQTLKEIEIICVNDGSTDESFAILEEYMVKDNRIEVINKANSGYGNTMNVGLGIATGEYIGIVESDDFVPEDMYKVLYEIAKENDLDFIKADFYRFIYNEDGMIQKTYNQLGNDLSCYGKVFRPMDNILTFNFIMNTWSGIYKRAFLDKYQIRHNETPGASYQDTGFFYQTFFFAQRAYFLNKAFYMNRRDNPNSSMKSRSKIYALNDEYEFIFGKLNDHPEIRDSIIPLIWEHRFRSYRSTYNRIDDQFKEEFLYHFSEVFKGAREKGLLNPKYFTKSNLKTCHLIIDDPIQYHRNMQDTKNRIQQETCRQLAVNIPVWYAEKGNFVNIERNITGKELQKLPVPKVSVIIPCYKVEAYIRECLDSICGQTLREIELICINDGSPDNCLTILRDYALADNRIVIINQSNMGVSAARNNGLKYARGEFVAFMDADDFYPSNDILQCLYEAAIKNGVKICGGSINWLEPDGKIKTSWLGVKEKLVFTEEGFMSFFDYQYAFGYVRFLYNRRMLEENDIIFPNLVRFQDPPFMVRAMFCADTFYAMIKTVYTYRIGYKKEDWTSSMSNDMVKGMFDILLFAKKNNLVKLHNLIVTCIDGNHTQTIDANITSKNMTLFSLLMSFNQNIDLNYLRQDEKFANCEEYIIKPFYRIVKNHSLVESERKKFKTNEMELNSIRNSVSFKLGSTITFLPKKVRNVLKCWKKQGFFFMFRTYVLRKNPMY